MIGFKTFEEKALYIKLISVKGVGPKSAMSILGGSSSSRVKEAIDSSDVVFCHICLTLDQRLLNR